MNLAAMIPPQASDTAVVTDRAMLVMLALSVFILFVVAGLVGWFSLRYREGTHADRDLSTERSTRIEIGFLTALILGSLVLFAFGSRRLLGTDRSGPSMRVYVVAKQWMWKVQHPSGRREINELHLPEGRPVRLVLSSKDVIHSLYIPAFRIKQDVLPDRFTDLSFTPTRPGVYALRCAEYCGSKHAEMTGRVVVLSQDDYAAWLDSGVDAGAVLPGSPPLALTGARVFDSLGCVVCHTDRSTERAPRLDGIYGRQTRTRTDELLIVDDDYIRESVLRPSARIVANYPAPSTMPTYEGRVTEEQLIALIEYLRSIRDGIPEGREQP